MVAEISIQEQVSSAEKQPVLAKTHCRNQKKNTDEQWRIINYITENQKDRKSPIHLKSTIKP